MATSLGSINWGTGPVIPCSFSYDRTRDGANMKYRIYGSIGTNSGTQKHFGYPIYVKVFLDSSQKYSSTLKSSDPAYWYGPYNFDTGWQTVSGKTSGSTSLRINLYSGSGSSRDDNYYYTLTVDPAASTIGTVNPFNLEDSVYVPVTKQNSSFTDTLEVIIAKQTVKTITNYSSSNISFTPEELLTIYGLMSASDRSVSVVFRVTTYNGTTKIGSNTIPTGIPGYATGTSKVNVNGTWKKAVPWVKVNDVWKRSVASVYKNNAWRRGL